MTKKGISFWEQHLEHIVLGVAVLFFLGFGAWQLVLRKPNVVNGEVPAEVDGKLEAKAQNVLDRLGDGQPSPVEIPPYDAMTPDFMAMVDGNVAPRTLLAVDRPENDLAGDGAAGGPAGEFYEPIVPVPEKAVVRLDFDAIPDDVVQAESALTAKFQGQDNTDLQWATVASLFSVDEMLAEFRSTAPDQNQIPATWFGDRVDILDVIFERERLLEDGSWGERTMLVPIPGSTTLREPILAKERDVVRNVLQTPGLARAIYQPDFLPTVNGTWEGLDPRDVIDEAMEVGLSEEEQQVLQLRRQLNRKLKERARLLSRLLELGGEDPAGKKPGREEAEEPEEPARGGGSGREGRGGGRGDGGRGDGNTPPRRVGPGQSGGLGMSRGTEGGGRGEEREAERLGAIEAKILRVDEQIDAIRGDLEDLGEGGGMTGPGVEVEDGKVAVWGHDIDVVSGDIYRYRTSVAVANPFFGRKLDLGPEQQGLADGLAILSRPSDWSDPVRILDPVSVFVTKAWSDDGELGIGLATAEVFRFASGRWWVEEFRLEPGDRVGEEARPDRETVVDFATDWYVLDIQADPESAASIGDNVGNPVEAGLAARVLLQSVTVANSIISQAPIRMLQDRDRDRLLTAVDEADLAAAIRADAETEEEGGGEEEETGRRRAPGPGGRG